jgi:hypothetical protein
VALKLKLHKLHGKSALDYRLYRKANNVLIKCDLWREDANLITLPTNKHKNPMKPEMCGAMQWLRQFVAGFSSRKPRFDPRPVHIGFVVGKVALGQFISAPSTVVFPCEYHFTNVTYSFTYQRGCNISS